MVCRELQTAAEQMISRGERVFSSSLTAEVLRSKELY
jgi:hypothetical protein